MRQNLLSVHSENILPIIKKWLYSEKEVFLRELVSNASDALQKIKILLSDASPLEISISSHLKERTLVIEDTGIGMTEEEVEKYIAQIAFSGAKDFVAKYRTETEKEPIIGHFGLGFYSAYMVSSKVEMETLSYLPNATAVFWSCDGSSSYSIGAGSRTTRGTKITLHIDEESLEMLEEAKLRHLLLRHCSFLPFPIRLNGQLIGNQTPLWTKAPSECTDAEYLSFYRHLFPLDPNPVFWVHLNVDYPFRLQAILYFPKIHRRFDANENAIRLYCNRVFVSDHCKDLLPDYLMALKGAIDSPDIPLNVSRSSLQKDKNVQQLSSHICKKVADRLHLLYKNEREKYIESWSDLEMVLKLGALQDEKFFERIQDILIWKNHQGKWAPLPQDTKKIFYTTTEHSPLLSLYPTPVLLANSPIDSALFQFLEGKLSLSFQRIDATLDEGLIDASKERTLLDAQGKTEASRIAEFVRSSLEEPIEVEAKSLRSEELPAVLLLDEKIRRLRDYKAMTEGKKETFPSLKKTFVVNTNHPLIQTLFALSQKHPDTASLLAKSIYDLSRLSQREMATEEMGPALQRQGELLGKLAASWKDNF